MPNVHLKVSIDGIELLGVLWQLCSDVLRPNEDALQVRPGALHLEPDGDDRVCCGELLLPVTDFLQEVAHELGGHHVLQLNLLGREGGREKRRRKRKRGGREGEREEERREGGKEGGRKGGREGGREGAQ